MKKHNSSIIIASVLFLVVATFSGCSLLKKISAAKIIINTKFDFKEVTYDRVEIDPTIMSLVQNGFKGFLPNPEAVTLVKDLSQGVIKTELGKALFNISLGANNNTQDTLWINDFKIDFKFGDLLTIPVSLADSTILLPGDNDLVLVAAFPLDMRIFNFHEIKKYGIAGEINVSLERGGSPVKQDFSLEKTVTSEDVKKIEKLINDKLLELLVNKWLGTILK